MSLKSYPVTNSLFQNVLGKPDEVSVSNLGPVLAAINLVEVWEFQGRVDHEMSALIFEVEGWRVRPNRNWVPIFYLRDLLFDYFSDKEGGPE